MKRLIALLLAVSLLLLSGCAGEEEEGLRIYYGADSQTEYGQAALDCELWEKQPEEVTPELLFERLMALPGRDDLVRLIPKNTRLRAWTLEEGLLTLDLSESYSDLSGIDLTLANYCLALTMTQLEGVGKVAILVEGSPLPGWGKMSLSRQDILLTGELQDPVTMGFHLYFPKSDHSGVTEDYQEMEVYGTDAEDQFHAVIALLVSGPRDTETMASPFVGLESHLSWQWVDDVCLIQLTDSWAQVLLSDGLALQSLIDSLCACPDIGAVAFSWTGENAEALEGTFYASEQSKIISPAES